MNQLINLQPKLEGSIVSIEPLKPEHYDVLYQVASDQKIWEQHPTNDRHTAAGFLKFFNESISSVGALLVRDKTTRKVIGSSRYKLIDTEDRIVEIGWTFLNKNYWGGEYNRAIKKLMVNYILDNSGTVVLYADKNNIRSQRAISKIGGVLVENPNYKHHHPSDSNITHVMEKKID